MQIYEPAISHSGRSAGSAAVAAPPRPHPFLHHQLYMSCMHHHCHLRCAVTMLTRSRCGCGLVWRLHASEESREGAASYTVTRLGRWLSIDCLLSRLVAFGLTLASISVRNGEEWRRQR